MCRDEGAVGEMMQEVLNSYSNLQGIHPVKAEMQYIKEIQMMDGYGMEYYTAKVKLVVTMRTADKTLLASIYMYIQYLTQIYLLRHFYGMQPYIVKWIKGMIFVGHNILHCTFIFLLFKLQFSIVWIELEIIVILNCNNDICYKAL